MNQPNTTPTTYSLSISTSSNFGAWLNQQKISLAFTTYQTNRLFLIGLKPDGRLSVFDRQFERPMGLFATPERLVMSTRYQIWQLDNLCRSEVGDYLEYDKLYVPRTGCTTGDINTHDLIVDKSNNWVFINTQFSCLATLDRDYSFRPIWQPPFISSLAAEDRCHLNGLAMIEGEAACVTACSQTDIPAGWRSHREGGGCVIDIRSNEIICSGLTMPHSPRFYQNKLWVLNSGTGELGSVENGKFQPLTFCPGFVRGLAFHGNYAIVGLSKPRRDNFQGLTLDERLEAQQQQAQCGLMVVDLTTGKIIHWLIFEDVVKELFDIAVLPGVRQPMALGFETDEIERLVIFPGSKRIVSIRPGIHQPPETPVKITETAEPAGAAPRESLPPDTEPAEPVGAAPLAAEAVAAFHRGRELKKQGKLEEAAACFREAISRDRNYIAAYNNLGNLLQSQGKTLEAIAFYQQALQLNPNLAVAHCNLASARQLQGEIEPAIAGYREALRLKPDFFLAHHNLGKLLAGQGKLLEAESCYQQALSLQPNNGRVYLDCGYLREQQGRWKEAIACFRRAISCQPDLAEAYNSLGSVLQAHGLEEQALVNYQRALQLDPNFAQAHFKLGELYNAREKFPEALAHYERALAIQPEATNVFYSLSYLRVQMCDWKDYRSRIEELIRRTETHIRNNTAAFLSPLMLSSFPVPLSLHAEVGRYYGKLVKKFAGCDDFQKATKSDRNPKKLRVGYLSPDFRTHPVGILLHQLFQNHDRSGFEIYAYSLVDVKDNFRQSIEAGCDVFVDFSEMSTLAAAQRIQTDGIHILVDLAGYTTYSRPDILALQPAPVQCSYLGFPDMTGADFIQYMLADTWLISEEFSRHCPEKIVFLPHYFAASEVEISEKPVSRQEFGLPAEGIVFCCFNYPRKIDPNVFEVWMRILQQVPESVLWLYDGKSSFVVENLRRQATACGIAPERLVFASNLPLSEYLARYQLADLFLDTFIYNGGATAIGALQAGVPLLSLPGDTFAARMGASICAAAGLEEMICHSREEYEQRAVYLATHAEELAAIRRKLQENRHSAPLFDMPQFARNLEAAFRQMWAESMDFDTATNRVLQRSGLAESYVLEVEEGSNQDDLRSRDRNAAAGDANPFPVKYQAVHNLTPDNLAPYDAFTFPSLQKRWQTHPQRGELIGVSATIDNQMVGMVIAEIISKTQNPPHASILSCYVVPNYRDRGIGTNLMSHLEKQLIKFQCQRVEISYKSSETTERALEPLLKKVGWLPPEPAFVLAQTTTQKIALAPWLHKYFLPATFEIFPWGELTAAEKQLLLTRPDYPSALTPFSEETRIEFLNSLGLRHKGEVIGWMLTHRVAPDTIRYSSLFVREPYQKLGRAIPLLSESIKRQINSEIEKCIFSVAAENQLMLRFLERHLRPYLTGIGFSRRAVKLLQPHHPSAKL